MAASAETRRTVSRPWADGTPTLPCKVPGACYFEITEAIFRPTISTSLELD